MQTEGVARNSGDIGSTTQKQGVRGSHDAAECRSQQTIRIG